jgi:hypothetical protein
MLAFRLWTVCTLPNTACCPALDALPIDLV